MNSVVFIFTRYPDIHSSCGQIIPSIFSGVEDEPKPTVDNNTGSNVFNVV